MATVDVKGLKHAAVPDGTGMVMMCYRRCISYSECNKPHTIGHVTSYLRHVTLPEWQRQYCREQDRERERGRETTANNQKETRHAHFLAKQTNASSHSVNLILFTVLPVQLILRISPHHSHHPSLSPSITPSAFYSRLKNRPKLVCFTNPFLHSLSRSIYLFIYYIIVQKYRTHTYKEK